MQTMGSLRGRQSTQKQPVQKYRWEAIDQGCNLLVLIVLSEVRLNRSGSDIPGSMLLQRVNAPDVTSDVINNASTS